MTALVRAAIAFAAGVLIALRAAPAHHVVLLLLGIAAAIALAMVWRGTGHRSAAFLFVLLGSIFGGMRAAELRSDCRTRIADGAAIVVHGWLESVPHPGGAAPFRADTVRIGGTPVPCRGTIRVRLPARAAIPPPGARLILSGRWWSMPAASVWPIPPERRGTFTARSVAEVRGARRAHLLALRGSAQLRIRRIFAERTGAYAEALLLARRDGLDDEIRQTFAKAGLSHLLAISGMHVALVAGVLLLLARAARLAPAVAGAAAAAATTGYVLFLGAPNAAARAALQIVLLLSGRLMQRPGEPFTLMAAAAAGLLVREPLSILDAGFQLSFAGVFGLLAFRRPILRALRRILPAGLADALATSLAATLTTAPIAALHFGMVSFIGVIANLAAIPALGLAVPAIASALAMATVWMEAGRFLAEGAALAIGILDRTAMIAAAVPLGHAWISSTTLFLWLAAVAAWLLVSGRLREHLAGRGARRDRPARTRAKGIATLGGASAAIASLVLLPGVRTPGSGRLEIHAIDVGQGDAFAVRTPRGNWLLIDTGPRSNDYDAGRRRVVPWLLRHGARRIDALILTHPHADHIGGARAVLEAFRVAAVLDPAKPTGEDMYIETIRSARGRTQWYAAHAGREIHVDDVVVHVLAPEDSVLDASSDPNDYSVVIRLTYGRFGALFLGDAPASVENSLVRQYGQTLAAQVLKVGHHGSRTSTSDSLLLVLRPDVALVPVGAHNRYGHPDPLVLERLGHHGVRILRTDQQGSITVHADGAGRIRLFTER